MSKIDEMFKDNEKIIIDTLKQIRNSLYVEENFYEWQVAIDKILDLYNKEKLNSLNLSEQLNKEKEKNKKIEETVRKGMKNLWVDSCAEDAGKYSAYMSIRRILEE